MEKKEDEKKWENQSENEEKSFNFKSMLKDKKNITIIVLSVLLIFIIIQYSISDSDFREKVSELKYQVSKLQEKNTNLSEKVSTLKDENKKLKAAESAENTSQTEKETTPTSTPFPTSTPIPTPTPAITLGQENALSTAKSYLSYTAFSRKGLIEQLEFEGYSTDESTYAVDNCGADWNEQAAKMAKSYMDYSSFSKSSLIEQLTYEGFTTEQANYGATSVGY